MQVVEKLNEGLSRVFEVTITKDVLATKLEAKIIEMAPKMNIKGFRPGKVPPNHVRKLYGKELMSEILQEELNTSSQSTLEQANVRPASQPEINPLGDIEAVFKGEADLSYELSVELMPDFTPIDPSTLELTRPVYEPTEDEVEEQLETILNQTKQYEPKGGKAPKAADGDKLKIDFVGKIDGDVFEGGSMEGAELVIGSNTFIPGFEAQLIGAKINEERVLNVDFPADYGAANLAGKAATFEVKVHEISSSKEAVADDEWAKGLGLEGLEALKGLLKGQLQQQYQSAARFKMKRALLDVLDEKHAFELPKKMVEAEFAGIWSQVEQDKAKGELSEEDTAKSEDDLKAEYNKIAERRVRLGLVLAEIGTKNNVQVTEQEVAQAIAQEARNFPGQEKQVFDYYRKNPQASAQIRAPIYEEKVVDHIFTLAKVTEAPISKEELLKDDEA
jgi:trigger factor